MGIGRYELCERQPRWLAIVYRRLPDGDHKQRDVDEWPGTATGFTGTNPFNQTWQAAISQPTAGNLQVLVYASGGTVIQDQELGLIARAANGVGGFIPSNNSGIYAGGYQNAYGAFGAWKVSTSGYAVGTTGGSPATLINFNNGSLQSNYLYRNAIPGQPQLNEMNTTLTMNTNQDIVLNGGALVAANGVGVTIGSSQFYGDGSNTAIGQNGTLKVMNQALSAYGALESGTVTTTGVISAGGDIDGSGNLSISGSGTIGGNLQVNGSTNSNGNISSGGYVVSNQNVTAGAGCSPNGAMANSGSGPLFCQSGVWWEAHPTNFQTIVAGTANCAQNGVGTGPDSIAQCPSGTYLSGGGYHLLNYSPYVDGTIYDGSNAPDASFPNGGNAWQVHSGGFPGNSCFVAYAICVN